MGVSDKWGEEMRFKRKLFRANTKVPHCCGSRMMHKAGYDDNKNKFYFCDVCGKVKIVPKQTERKDNEN